MTTRKNIYTVVYTDHNWEVQVVYKTKYADREAAIERLRKEIANLKRLGIIEDVRPWLLHRWQSVDIQQGILKTERACEIYNQAWTRGHKQERRFGLMIEELEVTK